VVLNFFSTTCVPCVQEMPALERVRQRRGESVAFVGLDLYDSVSQSQRLVDRTGVTWDVGRDIRGELLARLGGTGLPLTVVLDRSGTLTFSFAGTMVDEVDRLEAALDGAAAPVPSSTPDASPAAPPS
jgi:thiol-disulfide isomerase/thioredoxin